MHEHTPGIHIRAYLSDEQMTQKDFSELIGVHIVTIYRWINDITVISKSHRKLIEKRTKGSLKAEDLWQKHG